MAQPARRRFLVGSAAWIGQAGVWAQPRNLPVIGFLNGSAYALSENLVQAFRAGLAEAGYVEGRNVAIEYRSAEGQYDRLPALAADLVQRRVALIAATGTPTGLPAKAATSSIPIVFVTGSDPVAQGLVSSLSRPDGNLTGATTLAVEMGRKRLELLHQMVPKAAVVGALINPTGPNVETVTLDVVAAARALGMGLQILHASQDGELDTAFAALARLHAGGLVIGTDTFFNSRSARLGALTLRAALPAIYQYREFAAAGGLMSYGGSITDAYRVAGLYAGRILKGERPSELPVQQSTKAELYVNLATARAIGVTVPQAILLRAEETIT